MEQGNRPAGDGGILKTPSVFDDSKRLLQGFSHASSIGFAALDNHLRYRTVNNALAAIHGMPSEALHGSSVRDVMEDVAAEIEPVFKLVMVSGEPVLNFGLAAKLPRRTEAGYWIRNYFPIRDKAGRVEQVGVIVVEVTQQKKLERALRKLSLELLDADNKEKLSLARELHRSLNQYYDAFTVSVGRLISQPPKSLDAVEDTVRSLDGHIAGMRALIPIDRKSVV